MQRDNVIDIAKNIKLSVSMNDLLDRYGIKKNQSGFICCPFHAGDDTPSLKYMMMVKVGIVLAVKLDRVSLIL